MNDGRTPLKKILNRNKWFVVPAILVLYVSSAILMLVGIIKLYYTIISIYEHARSREIIDHSAQISANFLSIIENYILAIVFYILAISIYKLFIGNEIPLKLKWVKVEDINDLKLHMSKMSVLFLCTMIIQKVTEWQNPLDTLYFGSVITMICAILIWYSRNLGDVKNN